MRLKTIKKLIWNTIIVKKFNLLINSKLRKVIRYGRKIAIYNSKLEKIKKECEIIKINHQEFANDFEKYYEECCR